jgi:SAM-dependent methyltransferase
MNPSYREIWNALSDTEARAWAHISGYSDEEKLRESTDITIAMLRQTVGVRAEDEFLEIGCGAGRVGKQLAPLVRRWVGCDVAPNMLAHAARRLAGMDNVELIAINGQDLSPIPDASVDVVYCTVVFMHLEEWDRFAYVREAHRVLRPSGRIFCDNVNLDSDDGWKVFQASGAFPPEQRPAHISRCSTVSEIACYLKRAGFRDVRVITPAFWVIGHGVKEAS